MDKRCTSVITNHFSSEYCSASQSLKRLSNPKNVIFSYLYINSIRNKSDNLQEITNGNIYALPVAKTKLEWDIENHTNLIVSHNSGGVLAYVRLSLSSRKLECLNIAFEIQAIPFLKKCWERRMVTYSYI